ncbi:adenosine receptor A1-like [Protopterus annectens]|uniref:adenosine receptor A1-like n=1 Tax=Protopterus annectens TaxID=7888 RepID=UPI001CFAF3A4|nr:adenosine receptor A1-like [Protopterus annectens]
MSDESITMDALDWAYYMIESFIVLLSVLGNTIVVFAIKKNPALRDTTFCFIVSLAMADIAVGVLVIPLAITINVGLETQFYTCLFIACVLLILTQSSVLSLLAIAIDRYLRVKIPIRYKMVVTQRRAWIAVGICWVISIFMGIVPMFGWHNEQCPQTQQSNSTCKDSITCLFISVMRMDFMVYFNFMGWILLPLMLMFALYVQIFNLIRKQMKQSTEKNLQSGTYYGKELSLAKSLALVLLLFALCWLPIHIMNSVAFFCPSCKLSKLVFYIGIVLSHLNSAVNPIVYAFRIKKLQEELHKIWTSYICGKTNETIKNNIDPMTVLEVENSVFTEKRTRWYSAQFSDFASNDYI